MQSQLASLASDPPERLNVEQFDALLGYHCISCHATPACRQACDGFWFDDWVELATGDSENADDMQRRLDRVVARVSDESMPPVNAEAVRPLDPDTRALMLDFIRDVLPGAL